LTLRWTVQSAADPNLCTLGNAALIDVVLTGSGGRFGGEYQASCGSFATNIGSLAPDTYTATAQLLDGAGRPRTTVIRVNTFTILENSTLVIDLDFPANSFL